MSFPKAEPNSLLARIFLAFLATAGLFYVNIMPAIVDGLIEGLGFSPEQAGYVGSANVYGAAVGALAIVLLIKRLRWRPAAYVLLALLAAADLLSMLIKQPDVLIGFRFLHGVVGGSLVGVGFAVIARTVNADRSFGVLLLVQFGLGGLGNLYLPRLVPEFGVNILFAALLLFTLVTAFMLSFLSAYPVVSPDPEKGATEEQINLRPLVLTLTAIFLFQAGNMGLFAFIIGLGRSYGLSLDFITWTLALSGWIGIVGAVLVIVLHTRFGRLLPLVSAMLLTALGIWALHYSAQPTVFIIANCGMGITWALVIPYLFGLCSEFDSAGRTAALGGFASKMGLASGPMVAGQLLNGSDYSRMISVGVVVMLVAMAACVLPVLARDRPEGSAQTAQ